MTAEREKKGAAHEGERSWVAGTTFYGVDVVRFYDSNGDGLGDLSGITEKLDHIASLGVGCLWLLPFYPSDRADNGYAITDYIGVDSRFGSLDDFRVLTEEAHRRGIRILLDLVVHHTSSRHPWFQAAESDEASRYRDYYVWSKDEPEDSESESVFPHEEDGIWDYSERAQAFYRHRFYRFQPDLHLANEEVWDNIKRIVDFWVALGADGFRIDAATLMFSEPDDSPSMFGERFDDLRHYLDERAPYVALIGEADVSAHDLGSYFENGRFDLLYNFIANNAAYLSLTRQSAHPLAASLATVRDALGPGAMLNFMRNLDELDLEQLDEDERAEVLNDFAPKEDMHIYGRGIRRSWAAMMHSEDQLRMTMSLLFALPGAPLLMNGQEIGMGDDLGRSGRDAVRLPMQWSPQAAGGFTANEDSEGAGTTRADGPRGYLRVNVQDQSDRPDSLLTLVRGIASVRSRFPQVGCGDWQRVDAPEPVLALRYGNMLTLHNLSGEPQQVEVAPEARLVLGVDATQGGLPAYGFSWLESPQRSTSR